MFKTTIKICAFAAFLAVCFASKIEIDLEDDDHPERPPEVFYIDIDDDVLERESKKDPIFEEEYEVAKTNKEIREEMMESLNVQVEEVAGMGNGRPGPLPKEFEMHMTFGDRDGMWSEWSCCDKRNNQQTRTKESYNRKEVAYRSCWTNFCTTSTPCKDNHNLCAFFPREGCKEGHAYFRLMDKLCAKTCNLCNSNSGGPTFPTIPQRPTTTRPTTTTRRPTMSTHRWRPKPTTQMPQETTKWTPRPTTKWTPRPTTKWTPRPTIKWTPRPTTKATQKPFSVERCHNQEDTAKIYVFINKNTKPSTYRYSLVNNEVGPWKRVSTSNGDITSFSLYKNAKAEYSKVIYFCKGGWNINNERWQIRDSPCLQTKGWQQMHKFYAANMNSDCSKRFFSARSTGWPWANRISEANVCCGYTASIFAFYGPDMAATKKVETKPTRPSPTRPTFKPTTRTTTRKPFIWQTRPTNKPTTKQTQRPTKRPNYNLNTYNKECLDVHNLFRAVHGVPPLQWSPTLARTAQAWADKLKDIAPENPSKLRLPSQRTRNWPHSESGSAFRQRGVGENIAWDMSSDGSPAEETVLRWYAEYFYYDPKNPTKSQPNRPVGHLTQLLWKETTEVGCGVSVHPFSMGRFNTKSTWSVSHYNPSGNVHYPRIDQTNRHFTEMVPLHNKKSCMTTNRCKFENQCMGFGNNQQASCQCQQNHPVCKSDGGCIAWCKRQSRQPTYYFWKEECRGTKSCRCSTQPIDGVAGAICE